MSRPKPMPMPGNEIDVHRLIWSPDDMDGEEVATSAFSSKDLKRVDDRHISVSRTDMFDPYAELEMRNKQAGKSGVGDIIREESWSILFNCGKLRAILDKHGDNPFEVISDPVDTNPAHCGILNTTGRKNDKYIHHLRILLIRSIIRKCKFSDFISDYIEDP